jgi:hypothetical protein
MSSTTAQVCRRARGPIAQVCRQRSEERLRCVVGVHSGVSLSIAQVCRRAWWGSLRCVVGAGGAFAQVCRRDFEAITQVCRRKSGAIAQVCRRRPCQPCLYSLRQSLRCVVMLGNESLRCVVGGGSEIAQVCRRWHIAALPNGARSQAGGCVSRRRRPKSLRCVVGKGRELPSPLLFWVPDYCCWPVASLVWAPRAWSCGVDLGPTTSTPKRLCELTWPARFTDTGAAGQFSAQSGA